VYVPTEIKNMRTLAKRVSREISGVLIANNANAFFFSNFVKFTMINPVFCCHSNETVRID
jgi:hypothetical protein